MAFDTIATHLRWSNEKIAKRLSVSTSSIQAKRKGPTLLGLNDVERLAEVMDVPVEWFWLERGDVLRKLAEYDLGEQGATSHIFDIRGRIRHCLAPPPTGRMAAA